MKRFTGSLRGSPLSTFGTYLERCFTLHRRLHHLTAPLAYSPDLDGINYHRIATDQIPLGWASVNFILKMPLSITLIFNRCPLHLIIMVTSPSRLWPLALSRWKSVCSSGNDFHEKLGVKGLDTIAPSSGWWIFRAKELKAEEITTTEEQKAFSKKYGAYF
jgi:hypothetical protein